MADVRSDTITGMTALALSTFGFFMPKGIDEIRRADFQVDKSIVNDIRTGEIAAILVMVGTGAVSAMVANDPSPLIVAGFIAAAFIGIFEFILVSGGKND